MGPRGSRPGGGSRQARKTDRVISLLLDFSNRFAKAASSNHGTLSCGRKELLAGGIHMAKLSPLGTGAPLGAVHIIGREVVAYTAFYQSHWIKLTLRKALGRLEPLFILRAGRQRCR